MNQYTRHRNTIRLWQLISPSFPVGMFAWSQGLEYAVEAEWISNEEQALQWIQGNLSNNIAYLDTPLLQKMCHAWRVQDNQSIEYWSHFLLAARESSELVNEDVQLGRALAKVLIELNIDEAQRWLEFESLNYLMMFSLAVTHWHIPTDEAVRGYLWGWAENQVIAAIKLVPLGHLAGQRVLSALIDSIEVAARKSKKIDSEQIGKSFPMIGIGSAKHETQYTRLFRS